LRDICRTGLSLTHLLRVSEKPRINAKRRVSRSIISITIFYILDAGLEYRVPLGLDLVDFIDYDGEVLVALNSSGMMVRWCQTKASRAEVATGVAFWKLKMGRLG
jgi:hypothetical protein